MMMMMMMILADDNDEDTAAAAAATVVGVAARAPQEHVAVVCLAPGGRQANVQRQADVCCSTLWAPSLGGVARLSWPGRPVWLAGRAANCCLPGAYVTFGLGACARRPIERRRLQLNDVNVLSFSVAVAVVVVVFPPSQQENSSHLNFVSGPSRHFSRPTLEATKWTSRVNCTRKSGRRRRRRGRRLRRARRQANTSLASNLSISVGVLDCRVEVCLT